MNNNTKTVALIIVGAALMAILAFYFKDNLAAAVQCGDGMRNPVNIDNFTTKYWANSAEFEASIAEKGKLSEKLNPTQLKAVIDALQQANKFRKVVVAGSNSDKAGLTQLIDEYVAFSQQLAKSSKSP